MGQCLKNLVIFILLLGKELCSECFWGVADGTGSPSLKGETACNTQAFLRHCREEVPVVAQW